ncbi:kinase-like domain, phloem protein 2-like protein [Tanacetum coccineum]|uniref:Kinase-like domain, phloem protein 2-like protein n=1 Tax=Tanacetum coccineum TaxID=301880 RepID=A0ABQ5BI17_9ASTR
MRALYSSHIACFQLGSRRAWKGDLGIGEEVVTCKLYLGLAFTIPTLERVTIGCCEVGGGGGGVVGGVGVVCGDGVDRGVGGVDCGVVCGFVCGVVCGQGTDIRDDVVRGASLCGGKVDVIVDGGGGEDIEFAILLRFNGHACMQLLLVNDKGEVICERIYIEACLDQIQYHRLGYLSGFENSRFPGGRSYFKYEEKLKIRVRAEFLRPLITYSLNLVFRRNVGRDRCKTLHYKLDGETKCCMVYDTYKREDGWFVVPLYQFPSDHKTADFEIHFEGFSNGFKLQVAGFEFQSLEEKVELHDQELEEYRDIVKSASQPLFYKSIEELKELLLEGFHINHYNTWFSLNENGEHCEMLSISHCLISREGGYTFYYTDEYSRFPRFCGTNKKGFKVHIRTQFLTPSIRYTLNLVVRKGNSSEKQLHVALRYKLEGETKTSIVYLATTTKDNRSFIAELYQFTSNGRTFDLDIVFEDHKDDLEVEGILFQPLEIVEHEQLSNDSLQWTMKGGVFSYLLKRFNGQKGYAVDNNGEKSVMFSARGVIQNRYKSFQSSPESRFNKTRFGEVAVITSHYSFLIEKKIKSDVLSPETTYASYLIYKLLQYQPQFNGLLEITNYNDHNLEYPYIFLVSPETPFIGQKLDQNTHNPPLNRPKVHNVPRQRKNGWMEVKVWQFQTPCSTQTVHMDLWLRNPKLEYIHGIIIEGIELRPIVAHSV